ncbi:MAG TPA: hypothetical protein VFC36_04690 [Paludibacter sp.]|nr:hypothetical protein [Paludibacter sp.]
MRKVLFCLLLCMMMFQQLQAVHRNGLIYHRHKTSGELTASFGPTYCYSDAAGSLFRQTLVQGYHNYNASIGFRQSFPSNFSYRTSLYYGDYSGADKTRNEHKDGYYSYNSKTLEFSVRGEYSVHFGLKYDKNTPNTLYGFAGLGVLNSNIKFPAGSPQGRPNNTSGVALMGGGYRYYLTDQVSIGTELEFHYSSNDYVDGYHPITSKRNDVLVGISFTLAYKIF